MLTKSLLFLLNTLWHLLSVQELGSSLQKATKKNWNSTGKKQTKPETLWGQDKKTEIEKPSTSSKKCMHYMQNLETELGKTPKSRGISQSPIVQGESARAAFREEDNYILFHNVLSEQLQKQIEKFLEQQHENRIPVSAGCVCFALKDSWKTQLCFRSMWLESKTWRFCCWEVHAISHVEKSRHRVVCVLRSPERMTWWRCSRLVPPVWSG